MAGSIDATAIRGAEFEIPISWKVTIQTKEFYCDSVSYPTGDTLLEPDTSGLLGSYITKWDPPQITLGVLSDSTLSHDKYFKRWSEEALDADSAYNESARSVRIERFKLENSDLTSISAVTFSCVIKSASIFEATSDPAIRKMTVQLTALTRESDSYNGSPVDHHVGSSTPKSGGDSGGETLVVKQPIVD